MPPQRSPTNASTVSHPRSRGLLHALRRLRMLRMSAPPSPSPVWTSNGSSELALFARAVADQRIVSQVSGTSQKDTSLQHQPNTTHLVEPERGALGLLPSAMQQNMAPRHATGRRAVLGVGSDSHSSKSVQQAAAKKAARQMVVVDATAYLGNAYSLGILEEAASSVQGANTKGDSGTSRRPRRFGKGLRERRKGFGRGKVRGRTDRTADGESIDSGGENSEHIPVSEGISGWGGNSRALVPVRRTSATDKSPWFKNFGQEKAQDLPPVRTPLDEIALTHDSIPISITSLPVECTSGIVLPPRARRGQVGIGSPATSADGIWAGKHAKNMRQRERIVVPRGGAELVEDVTAEGIALSEVTEGSSSQSEDGAWSPRPDETSPQASPTSVRESAYTKHYGREKDTAGASVSSWDGFGVGSAVDDFESTVPDNTLDMSGIADREVESICDISIPGNETPSFTTPSYRFRIVDKKAPSASDSLRNRAKHVERLNG